MAMAGLIWLCVLVVIVAFVLPAFGGAVALAAAVVSLAVIVFTRFAVCGVRLPERRDRP